MTRIEEQETNPYRAPLLQSSAGTTEPVLESSEAEAVSPEIQEILKKYDRDNDSYLNWNEYRLVVNDNLKG